MKPLKTTLILGAFMGLVLVASAMVRPAASEKESLSKRSEACGRPGAEATALASRTGSATARSGRGDDSPVPTSAMASAATSGDGGPTIAPPPKELADLAQRKALRHADREYWEDLGLLLEERLNVTPEAHRGRVMVLTTEYLGLDPVRATAFEENAALATREIADAWKARNESIEALPEGLTAGERAERERQIQQRYEKAKEQSSGRVVSLLGSNPRHDRFRQKLGEWIDAMR